MILVIAALLVGCGERERDPPEEEPVTGDTSPAPDTASTADTSTPSLPVTEDGWAQIGECEVRLVAPPVLPPPVPAQCTPGPPGWASGPVEGWALATLYGQNEGEQVGYDLEAVDPDGDGTDALVVGVPHFDLPPDGSFPDPIVPPTGPRVYLFNDVVGAISPTDAHVLVVDNTNVSTGQSVAVLTDAGPIVIGDYGTRNYEGDVIVVDPSVDPNEVDHIHGEDNEHSGADVAAADVDASGAPDLLSACLGSDFDQPGWLRAFERDADGDWVPLGWLEGTTPYAWFGRPTVDGFDLDGDGVSELAIGEQHTGPLLESVVHLVSTPWRGHCDLETVGAVTLWLDFLPAAMTAGDLDGDGVGELVLTEPGQPAWELNPTADVGAAHVIRDPVTADGLARDASWLSINGTDAALAFGSSVAVGDFNGDGCADLAVGAPESVVSPSAVPGKVYVFHGPFVEGDLSSDDADTILEGASPDDYFGWPMTVGDFNGDGVDDLAISATRDARVNREAGSVYVLAGVDTTP